MDAHPLLRYSDVREYPKQQLKRALQGGVLSDAGIADWIPDPRFTGTGCIVRVVRTALGFYAVSDGEDYVTPFKLMDDDVRQYRVGLAALIDAMRSANHIDCVASAVHANLHSIGQKNVEGFGFVDTYLCVDNTDRNSVVTRLGSLKCTGTSRRILVLVPCGLGFTEVEKSDLEGRGIAIYSMLTGADDDSLVIDWRSTIKQSYQRSAKLLA
jgi:hypothetical protein